MYAADWRPGAVRFFVDGELVRRVGQAPDDPMQLEIAVFDFPERASAATDRSPGSGYGVTPRKIEA